jgi:flagellar motor switch protein FliG
MFVFANLVQLDDHSLQRLLREVDTRVLARALRGEGQDLQDKFFRNLSSRAGDMLREEIGLGTPLRREQVEEAQQEILAIVRKLDEAGELVIQRSGEDALV